MKPWLTWCLVVAVLFWQAAAQLKLISPPSSSTNGTSVPILAGSVYNISWTGTIPGDAIVVELYDDTSNTVDILAGKFTPRENHACVTEAHLVSAHEWNIFRLAYRKQT